MASVCRLMKRRVHILRFCTVGRPWRMGKASTIRLMAWTVWEGVMRALMTRLIAYFIVLYFIGIVALVLGAAPLYIAPDICSSLS